ncbi:hypothetical protein ACFFX0_27730 [Citricoccus parietis]|uniref:Uncharacterized protein n=1 Tax=Citricoccus parietis TaxID=592307 RepID=A0ABV5G738_9MICC
MGDDRIHRPVEGIELAPGGRQQLLEIDLGRFHEPLVVEHVVERQVLSTRDGLEFVPLDLGHAQDVDVGLCHLMHLSSSNSSSRACGHRRHGRGRNTTWDRTGASSLRPTNPAPAGATPPPGTGPRR